MNNPTPSPPVPPAPEKKSIPGIAWVGIGCGTILIICVLLISLLVGWCKRKVDDFAKNPERAAAELVVKFHPELEMVKTDDKKGEMTVRTKKGETITLSYKDISEGKFTVTDKDGNVTSSGSASLSEGRISVTDKDGNVSTLGAADLSKVPDWVPRLPNARTEGGVMHTETNERVSGFIAVTSTESIDDIDRFLKTKAEALGLEEKNRTNFSNDGVNTLSLSYGNDSREILAILSERKNQPLMVQLTYSEKKEN